MSNLITHSLTFSKESVTDYFLKPLFLADDFRELISVRTDIKSSEKLDMLSRLEKITKAYAQGTNFSSSTGVTLTQKTITVTGMKAEVRQNGKAFLNHVKQALLHKGVSENDIEGTVFEEIIMQLFLRGLKRDLQRQVFFGDTLKETLSNGIPTGSADGDYTEYNGFWKVFRNDVANSTIAAAQRINMNTATLQTTQAVAQVDTITLTGTSGTANIPINGLNYLATFATNLTTTATNFVAAHAADLLSRGIILTSNAADLILTAAIAGVSFSSANAVNVSGNLAGTKAATTANVANTGLKADAAKTAMQAMIEAAPAELLEVQDKLVFMCTRTWLENYKASLRSTNSESAYRTLTEGRESYTFDGIRLIVRYDWDGIIAQDFPGQYPHRCILTRPDNLIFGTDADDDDMNVELYYDRDSQENVFRAEYKAGVQYLHPEYIVLAY